ncbi:hypothetical protein C7Y47_23935 [Lysinibacillus sphaericus]|uniref:Uncharacterized protein n=1 Tax=Lysinibacillus sphaericus TaxID=1421 RepID=A0A544U7B3_LYSSH|nr:hypothetical protein [Lysinibacillus sp. SDF0037]TQR26840.1 hypothetical protein C7Y47_23935 [Lysinibacillus sp. SDF0037]
MPADFFIYIGTVHLKMDEEKVWRTTPRKLLALWDMHSIHKGWKKKEEEQVPRAYADQVQW